MCRDDWWRKGIVVSYECFQLILGDEPSIDEEDAQQKIFKIMSDNNGNLAVNKLNNLHDRFNYMVQLLPPAVPETLCEWDMEAAINSKPELAVRVLKIMQTILTCRYELLYAMTVLKFETVRQQKGKDPNTSYEVAEYNLTGLKESGAILKALEAIAAKIENLHQTEHIEHISEALTRCEQVHWECSDYAVQLIMQQQHMFRWAYQMLEKVQGANESSWGRGMDVILRLNDYLAFVIMHEVKQFNVDEILQISSYLQQVHWTMKEDLEQFIRSCTNEMTKKQYRVKIEAMIKKTTPPEKLYAKLLELVDGIKDISDDKKASAKRKIEYDEQEALKYLQQFHNGCQPCGPITLRRAERKKSSERVQEFELEADFDIEPEGTYSRYYEGMMRRL